MAYDEFGNWHEDTDGLEQEAVLNAEQSAYTAAYMAASQVAQQSAVQNEAILNSQLNVVANQVNAQLQEKYADWEEAKPHTMAVLEKNADLIPNVEAALDPMRLAQGVENAYKLGKGEAADEKARSRWQEIMDSPSGRLDF